MLPQVSWNSWKTSHANLVCLNLSGIPCLTIWSLYVWIPIWCWPGEQHSFPTFVALLVLRSHFLLILDFRISIGTNLCFGKPICFHLSFVHWCSPFRWNEWRCLNLQLQKTLGNPSILLLYLIGSFIIKIIIFLASSFVLHQLSFNYLFQFRSFAFARWISRIDLSAQALPEVGW